MENVISLAERLTRERASEEGLDLDRLEVLALSETVEAHPRRRIHDPREVHGRTILLRDAGPDDVAQIQDLYAVIYGGKYSLEFATNPQRLLLEITSPETHLWVVAEDDTSRQIVGAVSFQLDLAQRLGKATGAVVREGYRSAGMGTQLIRSGVEYLTKVSKQVDVFYALTRTVNEAPSHVVAQAGFKQLGFFPNVVQVDNYEHLNFDVLVNESALSLRRKKPYLFPPFADIYAAARAQLGLERPYLVTERAPLTLSKHRTALKWITDAEEAERRFATLALQNRLSNSFFPFHRPNRILVSDDGGTEVFVWFAGSGGQSAIVGYRTDLVRKHDLFDSVASALQRAGAAYVELLVDAYDYQLQQEAFTARYIPSAYFPAMKINSDGLRDDAFILNRTFQLLDFTDTYVRTENLPFLKAYLRYYHDLYIKPILGK